MQKDRQVGAEGGGGGGLGEALLPPPPLSSFERSGSRFLDLPPGWVTPSATAFAGADMATFKTDRPE